MDIRELLSPATVIPRLTARGKKGVLEELAKALCRRYPELDLASVVDTLLERERLGTTGIGEGVAIPHGKMKNLKQLMLCFGRSVEGVDFQSMDNKPAHLFFLLLAPENSAGIHLKVLAKISRMLKDKKFCQDLMTASTAEEILQVIAREDEKTGPLREEDRK
jgi:PTS system nitrogen regulatory IIA component